MLLGDAGGARVHYIFVVPLYKCIYNLYILLYTLHATFQSMSMLLCAKSNKGQRSTNFSTQLTLLAGCQVLRVSWSWKGSLAWTTPWSRPVVPSTKACIFFIILCCGISYYIVIYRPWFPISHCLTYLTSSHFLHCPLGMKIIQCTWQMSHMWLPHS